MNHPVTSATSTGTKATIAGSTLSVNDTNLVNNRNIDGFAVGNEFWILTGLGTGNTINGTFNDGATVTGPPAGPTPTGTVTFN